MRLRFAIYILMLTMASCSEKALELVISSREGGSSISGSAPMFSSLGGSSVSSSSVGSSSVDWENDARSCTTAVASIHEIDPVDGSINETAILSASIQADGSYSLVGAKAAGITLDGNVKHVIKASGCLTEFYKPLLSFQSQEVSLASSLISFTAKLSDPTKNKLTDIAVEDLVALEASLNSLNATNLSQLTNQVIANAGIATEFENVFNIPPAQLKELPPPELDITAPLTPLENSTTNYAASISHWNSDYVPAYEWELDGVVVSTTSGYSYNPNKNSQGTKTLELKIGTNSAGVIDNTKPVKTLTYDLNVQNTYPATAPAMTLLGNVKRNFLLTQVQIATGAGLENCESFTGLALTESLFAAPVAIPANFPITCSSVGTQTEALTISSGDGTRSIALWALDSSGNTSLVSSQVSFLLDRTLPEASLGNFSSSIRGGSLQNVVYTAADATSGVDSVSLQYAQDGSTFAEIADLTGTASPYVWTVPVGDFTGARLRLVVTDEAGNVSTVTGNAFNIDTTAPVIAITAPAANTRSKTGVTVSGTCETGVSVTVAGTGASSTQAVACNAGTFSADVTYTSTDGTKTITASRTDSAGNTGTASRNYIRDNVAPSLTITGPAANSAAKNGIYLTGACEYSASFAAQNTLTLAGAGLDSPATTTCSSDGSYAVSVLFAGADGVKTITVTQTDQATNTVTRTRDFVKDINASSLSISDPSEGASVKGTFTISGVCDSSGADPVKMVWTSILAERELQPMTL